MPVSARIQIRCIARSRIIESTQQLGRITARLQILAGMPRSSVGDPNWVYLIHRDDRQNRTRNTYLSIYVPVVATVAASQISTDVCKNTRYLDATRATDVAIYRNSCRLLCIYVARGFKVFVAAALEERRRGGKGGEGERDGGGRFLARTRTPSAVWPIRSWVRRADGHCLPEPYIISDKLGEQPGNRKCRGQRMEVRALNNTMPL